MSPVEVIDTLLVVAVPLTAFLLWREWRTPMRDPDHDRRRLVRHLNRRYPETDR